MRARILDAAVECLVDRGYGETTTLAVQERAMVSRGALLHYFPTRAELLAEALEHLFDRVNADLQTRARVTVEGPERVAQAIEVLWGTFCGPLFAAALELWVAARTDVDLRVALIPHERRLGREIRVVCRDLFGPWASSNPRFEQVCELIVQAMRGAAVSSVIATRAGRDRHLLDSLSEMATLMLQEPPDQTVRAGAGPKVKMLQRGVNQA